MAKQHLMTRKAFEQWVTDSFVRVTARRPYQIVPCQCGDVDCHGWRFIEVRRS